MVLLGASKTTTDQNCSICNEGGGGGGFNGNWGMGYLFIFFHHHHHHRSRLSLSLSPPPSLLSKTQSTLSICALLFFTTLLLFSLFQPSLHHRHPSHRRQQPSAAFPPALQRMGALYRRGNRAMTDLLVAHVGDGTTAAQILTFFRLIHHSGLLSRSDVVLIFESPLSASRLGGVVKSESELFLRLIRLYEKLNSTELTRGGVRGLNRYLRRPVGEEEKEPLWGKRRNSTEPTRASYGSIVGFDASELDPENSLSGFLGHLPMSLRRWACYPMLLGRVRRNYKHTLLIDVGNTLILSDPFTRIRNRSTESVLIWPSPTGQHNPGVILGGGRGVRRFAAAALTQIVRVAVDHKGKTRRNSVTEAGLVSQLVNSGHVIKNVNLIISEEAIPEASSVGEFDSGGPSLVGISDYYAVVKRGSYDVDWVVRREICASHELYPTVFGDCLETH